MTDDPAPHRHHAPEFSDTLSRLWGSVLEGIHLRLELFALELADERRRLTDLVVSTLIGALAGVMFTLSLNVTLLVLFWDTHRLGVALGMCVFYGLVAVGCGVFHMRRRHPNTPPFAATAAVLARDEEALREIL